VKSTSSDKQSKTGGGLNFEKNKQSSAQKQKRKRLKIIIETRDQKFYCVI